MTVLVSPRRPHARNDGRASLGAVGPGLSVVEPRLPGRLRGRRHRDGRDHTLDRAAPAPARADRQGRRRVDQVPLADRGYRHIYYGFLGLAAPLIGVVLCVALIVARATPRPRHPRPSAVGIAVAGLGGAFYIGFAQLLVALDNWLSHGIVRVTGHDLTDAIEPPRRRIPQRWPARPARWRRTCC